MSRWQRLAFRSKQFDPRTIPGLFGWWDFADSSTLTLSGTNITQCLDKSGNNRTASQGTANNQPTLATAARNGRNAAQFDGVNDALNASVGSSQFTALTAFSVAIADGAGGGSSGRIYERANQGSNLHRNNANTAMTFTAPWSGATGNATQRSAGNSFPLSSWLILGVRYTGGAVTETDIQPRINRAASTAGLTGTSSGFSVSQSLTLNIGNRSLADGYDRGWDGKIGELLIFAASLTDAQVTAVEAYLAKKWGF